jgi:hypothetical protein
MSDESKKTATAAADREERKVCGRRRMLLAGTAFATIGALGAAPAVQQAQAQRRQHQLQPAAAAAGVEAAERSGEPDAASRCA